MGNCRNYPCRRDPTREGLSMQRLLGASVLAITLMATNSLAFDFPSLPNPFGGGDSAKPGQSPGNVPQKQGASSLECPEILVDMGESAVRFPPGADSASVKYQLSLGLLARECTIQDDQIVIKVGVEGAAVLGPLGQPGPYSANLRVAVRRQKDEVILGSKTYRVGAAIPSGATRAEFRIVAEPLSVPYLGQHAADDYEILVGFTQGGAEPGAKPKKARQPRQGQARAID
jgi:hypothetical protein